MQQAAKPWEKYGNQPRQQGAPPDPRIQPQVRSSGANAAVDEATIQARIQREIAEARKAEAEASRTGAEVVQTQQDLEQDKKMQERKATRQAFNSQNLLGVIRQARNLIQERGGVGAESNLALLPMGSDARQLQGLLSTIRGNLAFDRLGQMREESKTGGALGAVSDTELRLLESTVGSLDQADAQGIMDALDRVERQYIGVMMMNDGIDPNTDLGRGLMVDDYGYSGFFDGVPAEQFSLAQDKTASTPIPPEYQQEHLRYLRDNWRNIKPENYVAFRARLDERYNLTPDLRAYENFAYEANQFASQGGAPEQLGVVPSPERDMSTFMGLPVEEYLNRGAQTGIGTYFSQAGNAATAGLLGQATGNQDVVELQREARPFSSFVGEATGGALGATALGAGSAALAGGGRLAQMLAGPYGAEALHSVVYGGTQGGLEGAAYGLGGSLVGGRLGQMIGRNVAPETFAGRAIREADASVPTVPQLKEQAGEAYARAEAAGVAAGPEQTQGLAEQTRQILAGEGRIGANGEVIIQDGPTKQAYDLISSFEGTQMTPKQAQTVRETLGEGLMAREPKDRRIAAMLLEQFDNWAQPVMPGAEDARALSRRYIQGQQIQQREGLGMMRGNRMKGNDQGDSLRTAFGQLDEQVFKGQASFDAPTREAISRVAQGDRYTNLLRSAGKYGFGSVLPTTGFVAAGGNAAAFGGNPALMAVPAAIGAGGTWARRLAERNTMRAAKEAELIAMGGPEYAGLLEIAKQQAANRGGNFYGGLFGSTASTLPRE